MGIELTQEDFLALTKRIENLEFQVRQLGISLDTEKHPLPHFIIEMGWGSTEFDLMAVVFDLTLDKIQEGETVDWIGFREQLEEELGLGHSQLKALIAILYRNHQWTEVCRRYAEEYKHAGLKDLVK